MNSAVEAQLAELGIEGYLKQHQYKSLLRFLTCGSVDDGKSTLIGRLRCLSMVCRLSVNKASQSMLLTVTSRRKSVNSSLLIPLDMSSTRATWRQAHRRVI